MHVDVDKIIATGECDLRHAQLGTVLADCRVSPRCVHPRQKSQTADTNTRWDRDLRSSSDVFMTILTGGLYIECRTY